MFVTKSIEIKNMVSNLFLVLICLLPFGHLMFRKFDLWHGTGHFFQMGLLIIFCCSLFNKPNRVQVMNKSLGLFILWVGLTTGYLWIRVFTETKHYPINIFLPFFNLLCFVWFYKLSLEYLDEKSILKILKYLRYSIIAVLFYCVLQYFNLDEFFKGLSGHDEVVGTMGNTSHLAGFLAIIQPIFFNRKRLDILALILLWTIILITGSCSGILTGVLLFLGWLLLKRKYLLSGILSFIIFIASVITYKLFPMFFTFSGRLEIWRIVFENFKEKAITGLGLGTFRLMKYDFLSYWRHAHNEYYQVAFETGIIGLCLVLWIIWDYFNIFRIFKNDLTIKLSLIFLGICFLSLFSSPVHLWQISVIGMMSYSFLYVLKNEVLNVNINSV